MQMFLHLQKGTDALVRREKALWALVFLLRCLQYSGAGPGGLSAPAGLEHCGPGAGMGWL